MTGTTDVYGAVISPNARWLAYVSTEGGRGEVYVQSFASGGGRVQISTIGGVEPRWSPDGRTLYYLHNDELLAVPIEPGETFVVELELAAPDIVRLRRVRTSYAGALTGLYGDVATYLDEERASWE